MRKSVRRRWSRNQLCRFGDGHQQASSLSRRSLSDGVPAGTGGGPGAQAVGDLNGGWRTFRAAVPHVKHQRGYPLAVSPMAAFVHSPLNGPYVASKAGVWALCDATRLELRHHGVSVGSAHPTFFKTPMMDDVHDDPAGNTLWGGNEKDLWKMITIDEVVDAIITGVERRAAMIVVPRRNSLVARVPGLVRPLIDRIGFRGTTIPDAIALATPSGEPVGR